MKRTVGLLIPVVMLMALVIRFVPEYRRVSSTEPTAWTIDRHADCAIVLTGGAGRTREGLDLLSRGLIGKLVISGVHPGAQFEEIFPQWPFYAGIDRKDVILERRSTTTYGNAHQSLAFIEALECHSVLLVTSRLHMYRAMRVFQAAAPKDLLIYPHAIVSNDYRPEWSEIMFEAMKSMLYSVLALA